MQMTFKLAPNFPNKKLHFYTKITYVYLHT